MNKYVAVQEVVANQPPRYVVKLVGALGEGEPAIADCGPVSSESQETAAMIAECLNGNVARHLALVLATARAKRAVIARLLHQLAGTADALDRLLGAPNDPDIRRIASLAVDAARHLIEYEGKVVDKDRVVSITPALS